MSEVKTNNEMNPATAPRAPRGWLGNLLVGLLIGLTAGAGLTVAVLRAHPAGFMEPSPGTVGVRNVPPPSMSLPEYVEIIELLPPDAAAARARLREIADPLIREIERGNEDDVVYIDRRDADDLCRLLPAGEAAAKFASLLRVADPAPGNLPYERWSQEFAPYLNDVPPELAFLRALPKPQADGVFIPGGDRGVAFYRAMWHARHTRDSAAGPSVRIPLTPSGPAK